MALLERDQCVYLETLGWTSPVGTNDVHELAVDIDLELRIFRPVECHRVAPVDCLQLLHMA